MAEIVYWKLENQPSKNMHIHVRCIIAWGGAHFMLYCCLGIGDKHICVFGWGGGGEGDMKTYYASTRSTKYVNLRNETLKQIMTEEGA